MVKAIFIGILGGIAVASVNYFLSKIISVDLIFKIPSPLRMIIVMSPGAFSVAIMGYILRYFKDMPGMERGGVNYDICYALMTLFFLTAYVWFFGVPIYRYVKRN